MFCQFCGKQISDAAQSCQFCGKPRLQPASLSAAQASTSVNVHTQARTELSTVQQYSNSQAPWRLVFLSILTFTLYEIYWFYRNWKQLKAHKNLDISPGWRTVGLFVPIYVIVVIYRQFRDIRDFAEQEGCETYSSPGWLTFGYLFLAGISFRLALHSWRLTDPAEILASDLFGLLVDLLAVSLLAVVQKTLNTYWEKVQPELAMKRKFSGGETTLLVIGSIIWFLALVGTFVPE